jgi:cadmium resistance protein CadD (predicted permease)
MSKKDLYFYIWAFPFIGAFLGFIINIVLQPGNTNVGVAIMLGCIAGYLALISLVLGEKCLEKDHGSDKNGNNTK